MEITAAMVAEAEAEVTAAERVRGEAEAALMEAPNSTLRAQELAGALKRVAQCRSNARELREAFDAQVAAERAAATREELEKAAAGEIRAAERGVKAARQRVVEAAVGAQESLVALLAVVSEYDVAVGEHADVLAGKGLGLSGDGPGGERSALGDPRLRVGGVVCEVVEPGAVAAWVLRRVVEARLSHHHYLGGTLLAAARDVERRVAEVAARVPAPEGVAWEARPRVVNAFQALRGAG